MRAFSFSLMLALLAPFFLPACAPVEPLPRVLWPPLPGTPRLEWLDVFYSEDSFPKTGGERFAEAVVGKPPQTFFSRPFGIASQGGEVVYVSDIETSQVRVVDYNKKTIELLTQEPVFSRPMGLALDGAGRLYVADGNLQQVLVFSPERKPLFAFGSKELLEKPAYLAINERLGRIYVSDGAGNQIVVFDLEGKHLFSFGRRGAGDGEFTGPQGLAIDKEDRVFVADQLNSRIDVFDADGKFLYKFGQRGDRNWQFEAPKDLAFDSEGNLHILDLRKSALATYTPEGRLLLFTGGKPTLSPVGFHLPTCIWIDAGDRIYITDQMSRRFTAWQYLSAAYLKEHPIEEAVPQATPSGAR